MTNLLNRKEAAELCGISERQIDRWRSEGCLGLKLKCYEIGENNRPVVRFSKNQIALFLEEVTQKRLSKSRAKHPPAS